MNVYSVQRLMFWINLLSSAITIKGISLDIEPEYPKKGNSVTLTCIAQHAPDVEGQNNDCSLWWTRTSFPARSMSREPVVDSSHTKVVTLFHRESNPPEYRSTLTVHHMDISMKGQYTCSFWCPGSLEAANIELQTYDGLFGNEQESLIGAFIVVMAIMVVLIGSFCLAIMDCCNKRAHQRNTTDVSSQSSLATENSEINGATHNDPPPRYSLVVVTSGENQGTETSLTNGHRLLQRLGSDTNSINSVFVLPTPPPNYAQALMDLAEKGIFFNTENIGPMPPAYKDLSEHSMPQSQV